MYIGSGIFLVIIGAILLSLVLSRRTGYTTRRMTTTDPQTGQRVDETRVDPDPR